MVNSLTAIIWRFRD